MINYKKVAVVLPAYNASKTLAKVIHKIPHQVVDDIIVVDDHSLDDTVKVAHELKLTVFIHEKNMGYGANQKTCFQQALLRGNDIIVMLHPDYQYAPELVSSLAYMVSSEIYDIALGSRMLGKNALSGGMPIHKIIINKFLTFIQNTFLNQNLSEYHTGFRAYSKKILNTIPFMNNSDDFIFDNEILLQAFYHGFKIGEISCPTKYDQNSSSIGLRKGIVYAFCVIIRTFQYLLAKYNIVYFSYFRPIEHGRVF